MLLKNRYMLENNHGNSDIIPSPLQQRTYNTSVASSVFFLFYRVKILNFSTTVKVHYKGSVVILIITDINHSDV